MDDTPRGLDLGRLIEQVDQGGDLHQVRQDFTRFMMRYRFGMDEVVTKLSILRDEYAHLHEENPIENISSRLKRPESIVEKMSRKGTEPSFASIEKTITDIAGVRVTCSFVSDVRQVFDQLCGQADVTVVDVRDYIENPKPNGYRSLHALVEVPVFLTDGPAPVLVEVQMRTIAMDFWASTEHKIFYKYRDAVPQSLLDGLKEAAGTAAVLDARMEELHTKMRTASVLPREIEDELRCDEALVPDETFLRRLHQMGDV
ncbi:MAG: GTP pyrophosphokinase family protein [Aeromicrobium sp.]|uniref:GTP pyrophosphokinase n=1 Tax=Aeromicrobium sp. TaxID=1871063 RepID=UPI003C55F89A